MIGLLEKLFDGQEHKFLQAVSAVGIFIVGLMFGALFATAAIEEWVIDPHTATVRESADRESWLAHVVHHRYKVPKPQSELTAKTIMSAAAAEDIDPLILTAQIHVESSFRGAVVGEHGEIGFMQVKEKYWKKECKRYSIRDKYENIFAGACALRWTMDRTDNDIRDALVAYNIGMHDFDNRIDLFRGFIYRGKVLKEYKELNKLLDVEVDTL